VCENEKLSRIASEIRIKCRFGIKTIQGLKNSALFWQENRQLNELNC
jgi:hypothetical protein